MKKHDSHYKSYSLIDSGLGRKLEQFGPTLISRPCSQAVWLPQLPDAQWQKADAVFVREGDTKWQNPSALDAIWTIEVAGINFKISPTDFGHLGIFPEQKQFWEWIQKVVSAAKKREPQRELHVLNLFAYSGGSTLAAAKAGAHVCHLDASKGMVTWARENAALNNLTNAPVRWIVEDVMKFLARELKRGKKYDAIILDPPSFGRGSQGEIFKIEEQIRDLLKSCRALLSDTPEFILFSCHTPGFTPVVMSHLLTQMMKGIPGEIDRGEMLLLDAQGEEVVFPVPSGTYARWQYVR